nr:hypothetical protein [Candidatus Enterousia merdequi]
MAVFTSISSGDNSYKSTRFLYSVSKKLNSFNCFSRFDFFCNMLRAYSGLSHKSG